MNLSSYLDQNSEESLENAKLVQDMGSIPGKTFLHVAFNILKNIEFNAVALQSFLQSYHFFKLQKPSKNMRK